MKKTYVWVYVANPYYQFVSEIYGPCNEQMIEGINEELKQNPLKGYSSNTREVLCLVNKIAPAPVSDSEFAEVIYIPVYYECIPVKPFKTRDTDNEFFYALKNTHQSIKKSKHEKSKNEKSTI